MQLTVLMYSQNEFYPPKKLSSYQSREDAIQAEEPSLQQKTCTEVRKPDGRNCSHGDSFVEITRFEPSLILLLQGYIARA